MYKVVITGFPTLEEAKMFCSWLRVRVPLTAQTLFLLRNKMHELIEIGASICSFYVSVATFLFIFADYDFEEAATWPAVVYFTIRDRYSE